MQNQSWQLLAASKTITIHNLQTETQNPFAQYNPHRGIVNSAVYNHTGKVIASCGQDGKIALHNAQRCQQKLLQLTFHSNQQEPSSVNCCLFSPKSKYIAAGSVNSLIKVWDMKTTKQRQPIRKLKGHAGAVTTIGWVNNQQIIASGSTSGDILLHDILTGAIRDSLSSKYQQGINNIKVAQKQGFKRLSACTNSGTVMIWDLSSTNKKPVFTYEDSKKSSFTCISISSYKPEFMACSSIDSNILLMDIDLRRVVKTVATEEPLTSISFSEDGQMLAAGGMSGGLVIYDLRKIQSPLFRLNGHDTPIKSVCFNQKQMQKQKLKNKQFGASSGVSAVSGTSKPLKQTNPANIEVIQLDQKQKIINPGLSSNKLIPEQQKSLNPRVVKNLSKNQQIKSQVISVAQKTTIPVQKVGPTQVQASRPIQSVSTTNLNTPTIVSTYQKVNSYQPTTSQFVSQQVPAAGKSGLQEKLMGQMKNMEMRLNQKFESLHLEIIRQMQISIEKMTNNFEKKFTQQKQLQNKIKKLQQQNQNLRKRTY